MKERSATLRSAMLLDDYTTSNEVTWVVVPTLVPPHVVTELARVLRVSLTDLLGQPVLMEDEQERDDIPAIRHMAVSLLLALGVPPHVVREIAGHSDIKVTMMVYAHGNLTEKAAALTQLGDAVSGRLLSPIVVSRAT